MKAILTLMLLSMFAVQAFAANILKAAECPATGDTVTFRNVREVYTSMTSSLTTADLTKGEFETTAQFKARKAKAIATADFLQPVLLEGTYESYYAKYDADKQRFVVETQAWDNMNVAWDEVFEPRNDYGIEPLYNFYTVRGVGLVEDREPMRSYRASNAFGVEVTVSKSEVTQYGVFDKLLSREAISLSGERRLEWAHDITIDEYNNPAVILPIPLQRAAEIKDKMRVGVMVQPKEPFTATGWDHMPPKIDLRIEINTKINVVMADILCAVIADQDGVVLKTIAPGG